MPIIPFRVPPADKAMQAHIDRRAQELHNGNRSEYLRCLVRADMQEDRMEFNVELAVERIVRERLDELISSGAVVLGTELTKKQPQGGSIKAEGLIRSIQGL